MTRFRISLSIGAAALGLFLAAAVPAKALNLLSYVSNNVGNSANGCTSPAFACASIGGGTGALAKTEPGGQIICLDNHLEALLTIDKPIIIECGAPGTLIEGLAGLPAITINLNEATYPNGVVTLRNMNINGLLENGAASPGTDGIRVIGGGAAVHVENVAIQGFTEQGIDFSPTSSVNLFVRDTVISNTSGGILVAPSAGGRVSLSNVQLDQNAVYGLTVSKASGTFAAVTIEDSNIEKSVFGLRAIGASAFIALSDSVVTNNSTGLQVQSGGRINSAGNNMITLNNVDGAPTAKFALK